jgi:hypothetical protein
LPALKLPPRVPRSVMVPPCAPGDHLGAPLSAFGR